MLRNACLSGILCALACVPVLAQSYNYSYGNSRVIQGGNGLAAPSSSYIGPGTMSQSARGSAPGGAIANPNLPSVNMGANVRTPGDNMYRPKPENNGLPPGRLGANVGMPGDNMRSDMHYYVPGQNLRALQQNQYGQSQQQFYYKPGGVATYAESGYGSSTEGQTRHF